MPAPCVFASVPRLLVGFATGLGLEREHVLAVAGLSADDLDDPDRLVAYESLVRIWEAMLARFPTEPLGLRLASMWSVDALGVVGYALRHAADGHRAIALYARLSRLTDPFLRSVVERHADLVRVRLEHEPRVVAMVEPMEMLVVAMVRIATALVQDDARPSVVCFRHAARHPSAAYSAALGSNAPIRFSAAFDGVEFPAALLDLPLRSADPRMVSYLAGHAEVLLQRIAPASATLEERVRVAIEHALPSGEPKAHGIAKALGLSVRSLQRELSARATSFSQQLDLARKDRALSLLGRPELSVAEVAFMLGYAEPRVFHRSFRRWTGQSPTQYRRAR